MVDTTTIEQLWKEWAASDAFIGSFEKAIGPLPDVDSFQVGDLVTRSGTDVQRVVRVYEHGDLIGLVCIKPDVGGVFEVGDEESNVPWRYRRVGDVIEGECHKIELLGGSLGRT